MGTERSSTNPCTGQHWGILQTPEPSEIGPRPTHFSLSQSWQVPPRNPYVKHRFNTEQLPGRRTQDSIEWKLPLIYCLLSVFWCVFFFGGGVVCCLSRLTCSFNPFLASLVIIGMYHYSQLPTRFFFFFNAMEVFLGITGFISMTQHPHPLLRTHTHTDHRETETVRDREPCGYFFLGDLIPQIRIPNPFFHLFGY